MSTSHENVSALYRYAHQRISELIENGDVTYKPDWDGFVSNFGYSPDAIKQVNNELKILKSFLEN